MEKTEIEELKKSLFLDQKETAAKASEENFAAADEFCKGYKKFLNSAKTEREAVTEALKQAKKAGFKKFSREEKYAAGDKVYFNNRGKALCLAVIGTEKVEAGTRLSIAHVDSPRLDLKPNPLYENDGLAYFKTHYYGGIKKYQWTTIPLALHGRVCLKNGRYVDICVGEKEDEPRFCITDLLPHLSAEQSSRKLSEAITGEGLNILIGSLPLGGDSGADMVKLNIMKILNDSYGIKEEDFLSAELEAVPAEKAYDIGFDRSMIGAYGHDDRVCAYPALRAIIEMEEAPKYTAVTVLTDKEETGSDGNTGLQSAYMKNFICDLAKMQGGKGRIALSNSKCLSADVNAAYDPNYPEVYEKRNSCVLGGGVCITKYTGARGKGGTSDASAEFMAECRTIFDESNVLWQTGELGKVDIGGGGTVAKYVANLDADVVDVGVPVLSMHAPFEIVSKLDVYMAYRAFSEFFKK
ncbi:MAG: aminopeptidase [Oscillospiraceae bacterium]|jgi:aspartyl aminopeptidase|nr:aminopeptidase [Oscillospiraceae bacterium]